MNSQEILIAFAKLTHAEKEFAVGESMDTFRKHSQEVSNLSHNLAVARKNADQYKLECDSLNSTLAAHKSELDSFSIRVKQQATALTNANGRIDQLNRQVEKQRVREYAHLEEISQLREQVFLYTVPGAPVPAEPCPRPPKPEKPNLPPQPGYEWYFSETMWQWNTRPIVTPPAPAFTPNFPCAPIYIEPQRPGFEDVQLVCGTHDQHDSFAERLYRNKALRTRAVNVYRVLRGDTDVLTARKLVKAMYE